ncbi:hypothetical protein P3X46_030972 [Hevea brasiliensis]|uniref:TLC domain-containing protein n=1 Tax=Hevea brasiliensis TaxID=3981 RepID=A0ABQ9KLZ5_HEVBR|nr:uncharacterized protein LOC110642802 [Hevea brasiliensis]XP_057996150.1 uncharacterized protein LOC110642802 [Hevea brasiliensis]XP_057996151.1 uncharacterized protein LOC110642802 [Hevea brasiliensis]KAJ9140310.1 hypothetical protein P3X46_030972 [Hevea brasiliensis]
MSFVKGSSQNTWHPAMTANTTLASYWLNWRLLLCTIWVLISITIASILMWKYENFHKAERGSGDNKQETEADLYDDETWRPCLKGIHAAWLLVFRVFAFFVLLVLLSVVALVDGGSIFYYYTQWTFTLVTIYFMLGSFLSVRGCYLYHRRVCRDKVDSVEVDSEQGNCATPAPGERSNTSIEKRSSNSNEQLDRRQPAGKWAFLFQIVFQMNAGAVMLTDCVFWFVIVPFLAIKDYHLTALVISMHSMNAIFLLCDTALNCMRFPWFRIAYFFIWTVIYVLFQWIVHAFFRIWWPYPFLDLSSPYAPLWYFSVGVMHIPCYGIFAFIIKLKHTLFSRWFPDSYQCPR